MKLFKKCKWGHTLDDAYVYGGTRYCRTCRKERLRYDYYRIKCKQSNVTDNVATWNEWAKDLWGGPFERVKM